MPRKDVVIRGAGVLVVAGVLAGGGAYVVGGSSPTVNSPSAGAGAGGSAASPSGGGGSVTANVFAVGTGGSPNCTRSASLISYTTAVSGGNVCGPGVRTSNSSIDGTGLGNSCHAATGGDKVGVKNGTYAQNPANGYIVDGNLDCSDGTGADYNPNAVEQGGSLASLTNWVTFVPADTTPAFTFTVGSMTIPQGNYHMIWENIDVNTGIRFNSGGESAGQQAKNIIMRGSSSSNRSTIYGLQITGSKNIMLQHVDLGPTLQCAKNDATFVPSAWRCNPSGPWFESQLASVGTATSGCNVPTDNVSDCGGFWANGGSEWAETYVHDGGAGNYENLRLEDVINHDQQSSQDSVEDAHPGCLMTFDTGNGITSAHNMVLDHYECFRSTGATIQLADSGVTIQNSVFGCQVQSLENAGVWDGQCAGSAFGLAQKTGSNSQTNLLFRYNTFIGLGNGNTASPLTIQAGGSFDTFTNTRVIANLFLGSPTGCSITGTTWSNNTYTSGSTACESDGTSTVLGSGDPITDSSYDTSDGLYVLKGSAFNPTADGSPALTNLNPTSKNTTCGCTDYTLNHDFAGDSRSSTSTKPGADG